MGKGAENAPKSERAPAFTDALSVLSLTPADTFIGESSRCKFLIAQA
jgi:hypothetical protein